MAFEILERLFSSRTRIGLLGLFFSQPDRRYYVRQIARELKRDISGIKRELDNLERAGILSSEKVGNLRYYTANRNASLFAELKGIIDKTVGVAATLEDVLKGVAGVRSAFLYSTNSHAPGEGAGDVDLLVVGRADLREINEVITHLEGRLGRPINYTVFDETEFERRRAEGDPFLSEILKGSRVILVGGDHGL